MDREQRNQYERQWNAANRDKRRKINKDYYERNKERLRERQRLRYAAKKDIQKSNNSYSSSSGEVLNQR